MHAKEEIDAMLDRLDARIDEIIGVSEDYKSSAEALQQYKIIEKAIDDLKAKKIPVPGQMTDLLANLGETVKSKNAQRSVLARVHVRLATILAKIPRPTAIIRRKNGSISRERYQELILGILDNLGGRAKKSVVLSELRNRLEMEFSELDEELLASGRPRWHKQVEKTHNQLMLDGLLLDGAAPGIWVKA